MNAQAPYIKWHRTVSPPHLWIPNSGLKILFSVCGWLNLQMRNPVIQRADCIFIEKKKKNPCIGRHLEYKPMLGKGQLNSLSAY